MSKIDVEALDIDMLMFYVFKVPCPFIVCSVVLLNDLLQTLTLPAYESRQYEIILDCTSFTSISEIPVQWLKFCTELIPSDIRKRLLATHILNPNSLTQRYLRRFHNLSAGRFVVYHDSRL
jgi:hypothetical protein